MTAVVDKNSEKERENRRLEKVVKNLLHRIEDNQQIQAHFNKFELLLLHCDTLSELLDRLLLDALNHFRLDTVSLLLNDTDHQMRTLCERMDLGNYEGRLQFFHNELFFTHLFRSPPEVRLGKLDTLESSKLFPQGVRIESSALLPLVRHQKIIGCMNFGSVEPSRFTPDKSTDFLDHLARIIAVCLENGFSYESLRYQSRIDMLTQIYNRRSFEIELDKELSRAIRHQHSLSCLFIDIDHFKQVNDTYGHQSGDECLRQVACQVKEHLRKTDVFARYGGEEFVILLPEEDIQGAVNIAERVRSSIETMQIRGAEKDQTFQVSLSIGAADILFESDEQKAGESLLSRADEAMYQAKKSGRNRVCRAESAS